jgi:predicted transposase/invertase (TIGR01784 family)
MNKRQTERNPLSPRNDYFFKRIFGDERDKEILTDFLKAALDIPAEDYDDVEIVNPISNIEYADDKYNVLDIKVRTRSGKIINVEIQRYSESTFRERIVYQVSKLIEEQIGKSDDYDKIQAVVCIVITEFILIGENEAYHNSYRYHDERTGSTFSDISSIQMFELAKLPEPVKGEEDAILDWLRFLNSDEVRNMEAIAEKNEGVRRAVNKYKELTASESERMIAESIAKQRRIRKGQLDYALNEGIAKGLSEGLAKGESRGLSKGLKKGLKQGRTERDAEIARRMAALGKSEAEIAEILGDKAT